MFILIFLQHFQSSLSGWFGLILILMFTINSGFTGTRLGLCWIMLEERYEEFRGRVTASW